MRKNVISVHHEYRSKGTSSRVKEEYNRNSGKYTEREIKDSTIFHYDVPSQYYGVAFVPLTCSDRESSNNSQNKYRCTNCNYDNSSYVSQGYSIQNCNSCGVSMKNKTEGKKGGNVDVLGKLLDHNINPKAIENYAQVKKVFEYVDEVDSVVTSIGYRWASKFDTPLQCMYIYDVHSGDNTQQNTSNQRYNQSNNRSLATQNQNSADKNLIYCDDAHGSHYHKYNDCIGFINCGKITYLSKKVHAYTTPCMLEVKFFFTDQCFTSRDGKTKMSNAVDVLISEYMKHIKLSGVLDAYLQDEYGTSDTRLDCKYLFGTLPLSNTVGLKLLGDSGCHVFEHGIVNKKGNRLPHHTKKGGSQFKSTEDESKISQFLGKWFFRDNNDRFSCEDGNVFEEGNPVNMFILELDDIGNAFN